MRFYVNACYFELLFGKVGSEQGGIVFRTGWTIGRTCSNVKIMKYLYKICDNQLCYSGKMYFRKKFGLKSIFKISIVFVEFKNNLILKKMIFFRNILLSWF